MSWYVDIDTLLGDLTTLDEARETSLSLCVYIDETAPGDLQAHVRQAFASASVHARVSISYIEEGTVVAFPKHDMACIVAGSDPHIGSCANTIVQAGVPVMVVTTLPDLVMKQAEEEGFPLSPYDVVYPKDPAVKLEFDPSVFDLKKEFSKGVAGIAQRIPVTVTHPKEEASQEEEPLALNADRCRIMSDAMGKWVLEACKHKRLAFAISFPFVRRPLSMQSVKATSLENTFVGLITLLPGADFPVMLLNQLKMILTIAVVNGEKIDENRIKELAAMVCGGIFCRSIARRIVPNIPFVEGVMKGAIAFAGTQAIGRAAIDYYGGGERFSQVMASVAEARNKMLVSAAKKAVVSAQGRGMDVLGKIKASATAKKPSSPVAGKAQSQSASAAV